MMIPLSARESSRPRRELLFFKTDILIYTLVFAIFERDNLRHANRLRGDVFNQLFQKFGVTGGVKFGRRGRKGWGRGQPLPIQDSFNLPGHGPGRIKYVGPALHHPMYHRHQ